MSQDSPSGAAVSSTEAPAWQQPYQRQGLQYAQNLLNAGAPQQYPGQTVVPFSQQTEQALSGISNRAQTGSPVTRAAQQYVTQGLSGPAAMNPYAAAAASQYGSGQAGNPYAAAAASQYGGGQAGNPYLDQMYQRAALQSRGALEGEFARAGRNINAAAPIRGDQLNNLATSFYGGAYENDRNRGLQAQQLAANSYDNDRSRGLQAQQLAANAYDSGQARQQNLLSSANPLAQQDYFDLGQLQGVGSQVEGLAGRVQADQQNRYNYEQNAPGTLLDQYLNRVNGNQGQTTYDMAGGSNRAAGAAGGALVGAGIGSQLSQSPWATIIGALGGGLLGW